MRNCERSWGEESREDLEGVHDENESRGLICDVLQKAVSASKIDLARGLNENDDIDLSR